MKHGGRGRRRAGVFAFVFLGRCAFSEHVVVARPDVHPAGPSPHDEHLSDRAALGVFIGEIIDETLPAVRLDVRPDDSASGEDRWTGRTRGVAPCQRARSLSAARA